MTVNNVFASVPVRDMAAAQTWYARILGRPADNIPMPEVAEWGFPGGGWLQVYLGPERASGGSVTLAVDDMNQTLHDLDSFGVNTSNQSHSERIQTVMIKDPDGNSLAFAYSTDPNMAR